MAESKVPMSVGHGWVHYSYSNGYAGIPISSDWKELYIIGFFGLNGAWQFTDHILRQELDDSGFDALRLMHGSYLSVNDYHNMHFLVTETAVRIPSWIWSGQECSSTSSLDVYVRK